MFATLKQYKDSSESEKYCNSALMDVLKVEVRLTMELFYIAEITVVPKIKSFLMCCLEMFIIEIAELLPVIMVTLFFIPFSAANRLIHPYWAGEGVGVSSSETEKEDNNWGRNWGHVWQKSVQSFVEKMTASVWSVLLLYEYAFPVVHVVCVMTALFVNKICNWLAC